METVFRERSTSSEDGVAKLVVDWMDVKAAPEAILELLVFNCTKKCVAPKCVCVTNGLRCTDMCRLAESGSQGSVQEIESADDDDGADSDEEYYNKRLRSLRQVSQMLSMPNGKYRS